MSHIWFSRNTGSSHKELPLTNSQTKEKMNGRLENFRTEKWGKKKGKKTYVGRVFANKRGSEKKKNFNWPWGSKPIYREPHWGGESEKTREDSRDLSD